MAKTVVFGDKWHELNRLPDLEHELFYKFLLVSPSYRLCHKISRREIRFPKKGLPSDWDEVTRTYRICGDVYAKGFEEWWTDIGCDVFTPRQNTNVILSLDFSRPRKQIERELAHIIDVGYQNKRGESSRLQLLSSKIRVDTLEERLALAYWRAVGENFGTPYKGYDLAALINTASSHRQGTKRLTKPTSLSLSARIQLSELISRQSRELIFIAENAARGHFPTKAPIKTPFIFDYPYIEDRFNPGGYPYSNGFTHRVRMRHPIFRHIQHLKQRKQNEENRKDQKRYPDLERLMREFNQLMRRES